MLLIGIIVLTLGGAGYAGFLYRAGFRDSSAEGPAASSRIWISIPLQAASPSQGARMPMPLLEPYSSLNSKRSMKLEYSFSVNRLPPPPRAQQIIPLVMPQPGPLRPTSFHPLRLVPSKMGLKPDSVGVEAQPANKAAAPRLAKREQKDFILAANSGSWFVRSVSALLF